MVVVCVDLLQKQVTWAFLSLGGVDVVGCEDTASDSTDELVSTRPTMKMMNNIFF